METLTILLTTLPAVAAMGSPRPICWLDVVAAFLMHPNYLGEQAIWVSFYLFSIAAGAGILNWSICGAVLLILLFLGSSTLGEYISKSKYPEYANYVKTVNRFFPGRPYSGTDFRPDNS